MRIERCRCDKPSPGGLTTESCDRLVTQEDMLCDTCREKCTSVRFLPVVGASGPILDFSHAKVEGFDLQR
jgi:hypothetical protein